MSLSESTLPPEENLPPSQPPILPPLFAAPTQLIGWQGVTLTVPAEWNFVQFSGDHNAGHFSLTDDEGPRLELRWETPQRSVDIEKSVGDFVTRIGRDIKKQKRSFEPVENVHLLSKAKKRKAELASFGWKSDKNAILGQGYGVAWKCDVCNRIVVAQVIGRGNERPGKLQSLASEVFASMECHGSGGWETWSVFGLRVEIPEKFRMGKTRLLTGRIEFEWIRGENKGAMGFFSRDERIFLSRYALANVLMQNESLHDWTRRAIMGSDKRNYYRTVKAAPLPGTPALKRKPPRDVKSFSDESARVLAAENASEKLAEEAPENAASESDLQTADTILAQGFLRDVRRVAVLWLLDKIMRRQPVPTELRTWHSEGVNKIFVLRSELSPANSHVVGDVIDSLESN